MSGSTARIAVSAAILYLGTLLLAGCPGAKFPAHDGYRAKRKTPWKKPKKVKIDRDGEAEIDGEVNYTKRKRARWYALDLPSSGDLSVKLEITPGSQYEDFDLGFEVYNPAFKVLHRSDAEAEDAGELKKSAELSSLPEGRYLVHIFAQARTDTAEFELRVKFTRGSAKHSSNFPADVDFPRPLAAVPLFEKFSCSRCSCKDPKCRSSCDKCSYCRNCSCRRWKCRKKCRNKCRRTVVRPGKFSCRTCSCRSSSRCRKQCTKKCTKKTPPPTGVVYASIIRFRAKGGGTYIKINRGANAGIKVGWKGIVISKKGTAIPGGSFTVSYVGTRSSSATVSANLDTVSKAGRVRLNP